MGPVPGPLDRRTLARILTQIESRVAPAEVYRDIYARAGHAARVGVTGPPGAGKSTLIAALAIELRQRGRRVGILAIDPSSPLSGGAVLGDRIRMQGLLGDPGVFIRSMASRGAQGGLASSALDAVTALDAFGMDVVILETIGAGQDEVDVMRVAQTVIVVEIPGTGDDVQSLKAGILEIADLYVVNKADLAGVDIVASVLQQMLSLGGDNNGWQVPVLKTSGAKGTGIPELADAIDRHQQYLADSGVALQRKTMQARFQLLSLVQQRLLEHLLAAWATGGALDDAAAQVAAGAIDPHWAAQGLFDSLSSVPGRLAPRTD